MRLSLLIKMMNVEKIISHVSVATVLDLQMAPAHAIIILLLLYFSRRTAFVKNAHIYTAQHFKENLWANR